MHIKEFMLFFMDEGPKGPNRYLIAQEFSYKSLSEGASYFFKTLQNELKLRNEVAEETIQKQRSDLKELKGEVQEARQKQDEQIRTMEREKADLRAAEQLAREQI